MIIAVAGYIIARFRGPMDAGQREVAFGSQDIDNES